MKILKSTLSIDPTGPLVHDTNGVVTRIKATPCTSFEQLFSGCDIAFPTQSGHVLARVSNEEDPLALGNHFINSHYDGFYDIDSFSGVYILNEVPC